ncbi:MAG TPA: nitrogen regulation protein NR(II) [Burkholderiaceae bacterium]|nr:nitrogen regulation protein NR(II) [Burkholderiaceae bacterium]
MNERRGLASRLAGLDLLAGAVVLLDADGRVVHANQAAEQLFDSSARTMEAGRFARMFGHDAIDRLLAQARNEEFGQKGMDLVLERPGREPLALHCVASVLENEVGLLLLELREIDQRVRLDREARMLDTVRMNLELVRNLAHEIKNPLGGIRGAAQLLESEIPDPALREGAQIIIKEADRLQTLVDRLLTPQRYPRVGDVNIHEVCERVRALVLAEFPKGLVIERDYDASLPEFRADKEQLIQALLNLVRNAAQSLDGHGRITLCTRIARQVTIAGRRTRLALDLHVVDNGPGVPEEIRERIFLPLVSGREGGSGLGLTLAQSLVQQHEGLIEFDSRPGRTDFRILLPLP